MAPNHAQARLARAIAEALFKFADEVEDAEEVVVVRTAEDMADPADEHNLGKRQRQIVDLPGLVSEAGLRTSEIASASATRCPTPTPPCRHWRVRASSNRFRTRSPSTGGWLAATAPTPRPSCAWRATCARASGRPTATSRSRSWGTTAAREGLVVPPPLWRTSPRTVF